MQKISRTWFTGLVALAMTAASCAAFASGGSTTSGSGTDPGVSSGGGGGTGGGGTGGGGGNQPAPICVPLVSGVTFAPPLYAGGPQQVVVNSTYSNCSKKDEFVTEITEFGNLDALGNFVSAQAYYGPPPTGCFQTLIFDHSGGTVRAGTSKTYTISRDMPACNGTYYVRTTIYSTSGGGASITPFTVTGN